MKSKRAIWILGLVANAVAGALSLYFFFDSLPSDLYRIRGEEVLPFLLVLAYIAINSFGLYLAITRPTDDGFDETLLGLWIRAKKAVLRKQIEGD